MTSSGAPLFNPYSLGGGDSTRDAVEVGGNRVPQDADLVAFSTSGRTDHTHRNLKPRHVQLIGIGGTIATGLFIQIGTGLARGGPANLLLAFIVWCSFILSVTVCMAEMVSYLPISSPFIRFAGRYVDDALGVAAGWNFFVYEVALATFEVTACNVIIQFWSDEVHPGYIIAIVLVLYALINLLAVEYYGETEFWAAMGKLVLIGGLIVFTFVAMLGGNPKHDRFGFRYWVNPGAFSDHYGSGDLGRFQGFLAALITASFTVAGPDYVSMAAGEAENPRVIMPRAYNTVFYRLATFFILGSLSVGILVPYTSHELEAVLQKVELKSSTSPYIIAMKSLNIRILPDIVNALILSSAFSAGTCKVCLRFHKYYFCHFSLFFIFF